MWRQFFDWHEIGARFLCLLFLCLYLTLYFITCLKVCCCLWYCDITSLKLWTKDSAKPLNSRLTLTYLTKVNRLCMILNLQSKSNRIIVVTWFKLRHTCIHCRAFEFGHHWIKSGKVPFDWLKWKDCLKGMTIVWNI